MVVAEPEQTQTDFLEVLCFKSATVKEIENVERVATREDREPREEMTRRLQKAEKTLELAPGRRAFSVTFIGCPNAVRPVLVTINRKETTPAVSPSIVMKNPKEQVSRPNSFGREPLFDLI